MKLKDFLEKKNAQGKINNEDFNKALATIPDVELPDLWVNLFDENFLTRDRAESDFKITQKIKAETLNAVDANLKKVLPLLDAKDQEDIDKDLSTYKKIELFGSAIPKLLDKVKGENPSDNEKVKQLEKNVKEFADKVAVVTREKEDALKEQQRQFEDERSSLRLDWTLDKKLSEYILADEFIPLREAIITNVKTDIRTKNSLQLDDKGQIVVVEIDPATRVAKPKFNGNDPVTIDSLLSDPLKNFLKKNNAGGGNGEEKGSKQKPPKRETVDDVDVSKMTLPERRRYEAQKV